VPLPRFAFDEPTTVADACALLREHGEEATVYAGGTELLLAMKQRVLRYGRLVNIKRVGGLDAIAVAGAELRIGALATHYAIEHHPAVRAAVPVLAALVAEVGNVRVRTAGTLGGNVCFAEPHADPPTLLVALGARFALAGADGARELGADQFFVGAYETARRGDEVMTEVVVPVPGPRTAVAYRRLAFMERPTVAVAAVVDRAVDGRIAACRVVVGAAGPSPERVRSTETALTGLTAAEARAALGDAAQLAAGTVAVIPDLHGSEDYKRHLVAVHVRRAVDAALGAV
jgi:carbon-monoxide dehydrogenase medium subunit